MAGGGAAAAGPAVIDAYASLSHYADHLGPIFDALPTDMRGEWRRHGTGPVMVAGYKDLVGIGKRPVIFVEHGAGQTYGMGHPSYPGGRGRENVALFICPSERVAQANAQRYPKAKTAVVGCPRIDPWLPGTKPGTGVVGVTWHWNALVCPESRSALAHYVASLGELAKHYDLLGHAHPRVARAAAKVYADAGIDYTDDPDVLFRLADVLVCDNSSLGWEFLATDRPVVWANAPWYRREVHHGLRFWDEVDIQVDEPEQLPDAIAEAVADSPEHQERRRATADRIYAYRDGRSAGRAAAAIIETLGGQQ